MDFKNFTPQTIRLLGVIISLLIVAALLVSYDNPITGIYQGILPADNGAGKDVTLFLYPQNKCFLKTTYLADPHEQYYTIARWEKRRHTLLVIPSKNNEVYYLRISGKNQLMLLDNQGQTISAADAGLKLYKTSEI